MHQIELEMQNEALRQAQNALEDYRCSIGLTEGELHDRKAPHLDVPFGRAATCPEHFVQPPSHGIEGQGRAPTLSGSTD